MEYLLKMSLLASQIMMANAVSVIAHEGEDFTEEIMDIVNFFNRVSASERSFNLLEFNIENSPEQTENSVTINILLKETVCLKSQNTIQDDCTFKRGGEVTKCTVPIDTLDRRITSGVKCENVSGFANYDGGSEVLEGNLHKLMILKRKKDISSLGSNKVEKKLDCVGCIFSLLPR